MTDYLRVVGWEQFQHYKDRDPPWIKLHRTLLDNYEFAALGDAAKAHLMGIWLLAGRHGNKIPADPAWVGQRIAATTQVDLSALVGAGFLVDWMDGEAVGKREEWPTRHIPKAVKAAVWARDAGQCRTCGCAENLEFDHLIPVSLGGLSSQENVQLLCRKCNRRKRNKLSAAEQGAGQPPNQTAKLRSLEGEERRDRGETEESRGEAPPPVRGPVWVTSLSPESRELIELTLRSATQVKRVGLLAGLGSLFADQDPGNRHFTPAEISEAIVACAGLGNPLTPKTLASLMLRAREASTRPAGVGPEVDEFTALARKLRAEEAATLDAPSP